MPYDDIRFSHWDDPDDDMPDDNSYDMQQALLHVYDAIGMCVGCSETTQLNGYGYCEFCMDDLEE